MRRRDFLVFALICIFLLVTLQQEGSISFEKSFYFEQKNGAGVVENSHEHHPSNHYSTTLPKPIITDLDQDGFNEMLVVSDQGHLKLIRLKPLAQTSSTIHPKFFTVLPAEKTFDVDNHVKSNGMAHLGHEYRDAVDHDTVHVVGLAAGFIEHKKSNGNRKQIVIVVLSNWKVICFDHGLNLLWETDLAASRPRNALGSPSEVVITIIPYRIHLNDKGMVVIGLRYQFNQDYHTRASVNIELEQEMIELSKHYSYYAFNAENGESRWKHESSDFQFQHEADKLIPQHNHKLDAYQHLEHTGEVHWATYKNDLLRQLPHLFRHDHDTLFFIDHFNATSPKSRKSSSPDLSNIANFAPIGSKLREALQITSQSYKSRALNIPPNVLIAHLSKGIEVIHLYTGRTLCQLAPLQENTAYADLNGDGIIESVEEGNCMGTIVTGVPSLLEPVFKGSICKMKTGSISQFYLGLLETQPTNELLSEEDQYESVTPAILEYYSSGRTARDAVFFVESGLVTTVTSDKEQHFKIKWQSSTPSKFNKKHERNDEWYFAEVRPYAFRNMEHHSYILTVGESFLTVLDIHGSTQQVIPLPEPIIEPVMVTSDVNGDGLNDIIITTRKGLYAFRARSRAGMSVVSVLVVSLFVLVSIMYMSTMINLKDPDYVKKPKDL